MIFAALALAGGATASRNDMYTMGRTGADCTSTCAAKGLRCNPNVVTNNSDAIFLSLGVYVLRVGV